MSHLFLVQLAAASPFQVVSQFLEVSLFPQFQEASQSLVVSQSIAALSYCLLRRLDLARPAG
jgi:hypothetical protein